MKTCSKCGHENADTSKFCGRCGNSFASFQPVPNLPSQEESTQQPNNNQSEVKERNQLDERILSVIDYFTIKAQEVVQEAITIAERAGQQYVDPEYLLKAIFVKDREGIHYIFTKLGVSASQVEHEVDRVIYKHPSLNGGNPILMHTTKTILQRSKEKALQMGDKFASLDHMIMALCEVNSTASRILHNAGIESNNLRSVIVALRLRKQADPIPIRNQHMVQQRQQQYFTQNENSYFAGSEMTFSKAVDTCLSKKYATFEGRAGRKEYWYYYLFWCLVNISLYIIIVVLGINGVFDEYDIMIFSGICFSVFQIGTFLPNLAVTVRRLHDTGRSGWWILIILLPLLGAIVLFIFMCLSSERADNEYGAYIP